MVWRAYFLCRLSVVPKPWNKTVVASFAAINQKLFVTNPILNQVLYLWYKLYRYTTSSSSRV